MSKAQKIYHPRSNAARVEKSQTIVRADMEGVGIVHDIMKHVSMIMYNPFGLSG